MTNTRDQLNKALTLLSRAAIDVRPVLYMAGEGDESGQAITPELRNELLKKLAAGEYVAVDVDLLAFEQKTGEANRNFVRFRDQALDAMGRTGRNKPFLRDHSQSNQMAVAGRVIASRTTRLTEGHYQIHQRARLTATWAVDLALRDLLHAVSIGWEPTGPVECTVCNADIRRDGWACHWPGMRVSEMTGADGKKKYSHDRNGAMTVEWRYTDADLIETSMCPIGGVRTAGVGGVRAALAAAGIEFSDEESPLALGAIAAAAADSTPIAPVNEPVLTHEEPMTTKLESIAGTLASIEPTVVILTAEQGAHYAKLSQADQAKFIAKTSAERDVDVAAALAGDPVEYTTKAGLAIRKSHGPVALMLAKQADESKAALDAQAAQLAAATEANTLAALAAQARSEFGHLAGADATKIAILRALSAIADEPTRLEALRMLKAADAAVAHLGKAPGVNPEKPTPDDSLQGRFDALVLAHQEQHKCDARTARLAVVKTDEGRALYNAIDRAAAVGHQPTA